MPPKGNTGKYRKYRHKEYYYPIERNGHPFLYIRRPRYPEEPTEQRVVDNIILALENFNFRKITSKSVDDLAAHLVNESTKDDGHILIPLGRYGIIDYDIRLEPLGLGSLNTEDSVDPRTDLQSPIVKLRFTNTVDIKGKGASTRLAIVLGRIVGPHQHKERLVQSRWIVLLDQTRLLWVVYANGIDEKDVAASNDGGPVPYSIAWDTAFGAQKQFGQKVVLLGPLENIPFKVNKELPEPQIHAIDWSTTFVTDHQTSPTSTPTILISAATIKRLLDTNISFFRLPRYKKKNMAWLKNFLRFEGFCKDLDEGNKVRGLIIGRNLAEAAWCQILIRAYKFMDKDIKQREGAAFRANLECLSECLAQRRGEKIFRYWLGKSIEYPGLDLVNTPDDDPTGDHLSGLKEWAIAMMRENKNQGNTSMAFQSAVTSDADDAEDAAALQTQPKPVNDIDMGGSSHKELTPDSTLVIRAKAESEGLIRTIKKDAGANAV